MFVNGVEAWAVQNHRRFPLSTQQYAGGTRWPDATPFLVSFQNDPFPTWTFRLPNGVTLRHEIFVPKGRSVACLRWMCEDKNVSLEVRPLLSGRDVHALHHENDAFRFESNVSPGTVSWRPYDALPPVWARSNGQFRPDPQWYRRFWYERDFERGLDASEDLASPGVFVFLNASQAVLTFGLGNSADIDEAEIRSANARTNERNRRATFSSSLTLAADAYIVNRKSGRSIVAGYPWFGDWGRDTFVAMRGLMLSTGRMDDALATIDMWGSAISEGMIPNFFPDDGGTAMFNSVDASLWFVVSVHEFLRHPARPLLSPATRERLLSFINAVLDGYKRGTRYGIRTDNDGLLSCGQEGVALTWMDAVIDGRAITPRVGKPVEVQALWINALRVGQETNSTWAPYFQKAIAAFQDRFWNNEARCLYDVIDADHVPGRTDASIRPNQIFAVGGLPFSLLGGERAEQVVRVVEKRLLTPMGLRTLDPAHPDYVAIYQGSPKERDRAYHQGPAWPWLIGAFVEAWWRVNGAKETTAANAYKRFIEPLNTYRHDSGSNHLPELADGAAPHRSRGCPFQAWSLGELIRATQLLKEANRELDPSSPQ